MNHLQSIWQKNGISIFIILWDTANLVGLEDRCSFVVSLYLLFYGSIASLEEWKFGFSPLKLQHNLSYILGLADKGINLSTYFVENGHSKSKHNQRNLKIHEPHHGNSYPKTLYLFFNFFGKILFIYFTNKVEY